MGKSWICNKTELWGLRAWLFETPVINSQTCLHMPWLSEKKNERRKGKNKIPNLIRIIVRRAYLSISLSFYSPNIHQSSSSKNSILFFSIFPYQKSISCLWGKSFNSIYVTATLDDVSRLFQERDLSNTQKPIFLNLFFSLLLPAEKEKIYTYTHKNAILIQNDMNVSCKINAKSYDENAKLLLKWPK